MPVPDSLMQLCLHHASVAKCMANFELKPAIAATFPTEVSAIGFRREGQTKLGGTCASQRLSYLPAVGSLSTRQINSEMWYRTI